MKKTLQKTVFALGTVNTISVHANDCEAALDLAAERIKALDELLSVFKEDSDISRINRAAGRSFITAF